MDASKARFLHGQSLLYVVAFVLAVNLMVDGVSGVSWWSLGATTCGLRNGQVRERNHCPNCAALAREGILTTHQEGHCLNQPAIIPSISRGARHAIVDCQKRFRNSRWNCSTLYGEYLFGRFVSQAYTRETAVLTSYFTASAIWGIASDCHSQRIPDCPCTFFKKTGTRDNDGNLILASCNANIAWATNYLKKFVKNAISNTTVPGGAEKHNIALAEEIMETSLACRCHGVSGTCTVQTCYYKVQKVEELGDILFQKYNGAQQVNNLNMIGTPSFNKTLVYIDHSPDFCVRNNTKGITGVAHRLCDSNSNNANACSTICCNYGFYSKERIVPHKECEFVWCCRIECKIIRNDTIIEHRCNPPS